MCVKLQSDHLSVRVAINVYCYCAVQPLESVSGVCDMCVCVCVLCVCVCSVS